MDRLAAALGTDATLLVKRDDLTGLALGGNKARKLALLAADAVAVGADCLVTGGGPQSNHARITAAAARRLGLECHLALGGDRPERHGGQPPPRHAARRPALTSPAPTRTTRSRRRSRPSSAQLRADGRRPYLIPVGGASVLGVVAYALAVDELRAQIDHDPDVDRRGRRLGRHARGPARRARRTTRARRSSVSTSGRGPISTTEFPSLRPQRRSISAVRRRTRTVIVDHDHVGGGYGELSDECLARDSRSPPGPKGWSLDPVYSGKAMAALVTAVRDGRIRGSDTVGLLGDRWITGVVRGTVRGGTHRRVTRNERAPKDPLAVCVVQLIRRRRAPCTRPRHRAPTRRAPTGTSSR